MSYRITNTNPGERGIWSRGDLVWLAPRETKVIDPDDLRRVRRTRGLKVEVDEGEVPEPPADLTAAVAKPDPLDQDGDGKKGGSRKGAASTRARGAAKRKSGARTKASR